MNLEPITCNHCGAPLRVPESANFITCTHCNTSLAVHRSGGARFTEVLQGVHQELVKLNRHHEIATLDREWDQEKQQYLVKNDEGQATLPTRFSNMVSGALVTFVGVVWTWIGIDSLRESSLAFLAVIAGVVVFILGIALIVIPDHRIAGYKRAHTKYQRRRRELMAEGQRDSAQARS